MDIIDYQAIGHKIRTARLNQKLSQENLAEKCNISTSFLGHIERGTRKMSLETLVSISKELNLSIDYLLLDELPSCNSTINHVLDFVQQKHPEKYNAFVNIILALADGIERL